MNTKVVGTLNIPGRLESACRVRDPNYISPTINTMNGGGREPKIIEKPVLVGGVGEKNSNNNTQYYQQNRIYDAENIALCLSANQQFNPYYKKGNMENVRIRKLTPKECWRLMGFTDEDFNKAKEVNSDSQLYKQAGNSIVVQVLENIFKEML